MPRSRNGSVGLVLFYCAPWSGPLGRPWFDAPCFWGTRMANTLVAKLVKRFKTIYTGTPKWAWQFEPSIPLIGKKYKPGNGLLIYASAENLSWLNGQELPARFRGERAYNRYDWCLSLNLVLSGSTVQCPRGQYSSERIRPTSW